jgi:hypothetical protein
LSKNNIGTLLNSFKENEENSGNFLALSSDRKQRINNKLIAGRGEKR